MRVIAGLVLSLVFRCSAFAQVPKGNVFIGYSYLSEDTNTSGRANLNGWNGSLEGKVLPFLGIVADFGGHYGDRGAFCIASVTGSACTKINDKIYSALFGPRVSFSVHGVRPFAHVLIGISHENLIGSTDNSFATAVGGGVDFKIVSFAGWRLKADALHTHFFNLGQTDLRVSTGLVLRF